MPFTVEAVSVSVLHPLFSQDPLTEVCHQLLNLTLDSSQTPKASASSLTGDESAAKGSRKESADDRNRLHVEYFV